MYPNRFLCDQRGQRASGKCPFSTVTRREASTSRQKAKRGCFAENRKNFLRTGLITPSRRLINCPGPFRYVSQHASLESCEGVHCMVFFAKKADFRGSQAGRGTRSPGSLILELSRQASRPASGFVRVINCGKTIQRQNRAGWPHGAKHPGAQKGKEVETCRSTDQSKASPFPEPAGSRTPVSFILSRCLVS